MQVHSPGPAVLPDRPHVMVKAIQFFVALFYFLPCLHAHIAGKQSECVRLSGKWEDLQDGTIAARTKHFRVHTLLCC